MKRSSSLPLKILALREGFSASATARLLRLLGQQDGLNVGQDTALRNRHARKQLVQLFVVANGQLMKGWGEGDGNKGRDR